MARSEQDNLISWGTYIGSTRPYTDIPGFNSLFEACMEAFPALDIPRIKVTHLEGFNSAAYLLRPEFV